MCFLFIQRRNLNETKYNKKDFNKGVNKMTTNLINKKFNKKENSEMNRLDLYESRMFGRICYGFGRDEDGYVYVKEEEANVVRKIFEMAINGNSLHAIQVELFNRGIKSPSGKDEWTRDVIDKTINNKKYVPHIIEFDNYFIARGEKELRCRYIRS